MKFFFSPLVLLTVLLASAFAAPTERALSRRFLDFNFGSIDFSNGPISIRGVEATVDEHHLGKRAVTLSFTLGNISITIKRGTEEADEELSKRSEEYNLIVTLLPSVKGLSGRSTDAYAGRHLVVSIPNSMDEALRKKGMTRNQMSQYLSQTVHAKDPETGYEYQLIPDDGSVPTSVDDILLNLIYQPTSA